MKKDLPRRKFLQATGVAAASTLAWGSPARGPAEGPTSSERTRLLVGCCAYSFSKYFESGKMTMEDFILKGVVLGVQGVDITTYWLKSTEPAYLASLRHLAYRNGMPFSGAAIGTNLCQARSGQRAEELAKIKHWVEVTDQLGASHLRIFGGELPQGASPAQGISWAVEILKPACDFAGKRGVILGLENHGGISSKASTILEILRRVDSPFLGINLDVSNYTEDQYAQIEASIPYASHTHIRDVFSGTREAIDLDRVFQLLASGGYKGYVSAEYEAEEDAMTGVPKLLAKMKTLCRKYSSV